MEVTETSTDGLKREYKVVISAKDIESKVDNRLQELGRDVRVPGFRPGKAPPALLKKRFGSAVLGEVVDRAVNDSADQALSERGVRPALQPRIEITSYEEGSDLEYTLAVETLPEIKAMDFSKLELDRQIVKVEDKEVDDVLKRLADQYKGSEAVATSRESKTGDILVIDFIGRVDGKEFAGGAATDHHLEIGSSSFIAGFEEQLIGVAPGGKVDVKVTFPTEYGNAELAGKDAVFAVEIKEIRAPKPAALDDDLAKLTGEENLAALRKSIRERVEQEYSSVSRMKLKRALLDVLADEHDFGVPDGMVDVEFDSIWPEVEEAKKRDTLEEGDKGKSDADLRVEYRSIAERRVRLGLLLSEVGQGSNITIESEEISNALLAEAQRHPGHEREIIDRYQKSPELLANLRAPLFENKVVDYILERATITDHPVSVDVLMAEPKEAAAESKPKAKGKPKAKSKKAAKSGGKA